MPYTDNFRRQHQEILAIVGDINQQLKPDPVKRDAKALRSLLSSLAGKLSIHLAMEDKALYPRMIAADVANSKAMATSFMTEMGGMAEAFAAYNQKWQVGAISADQAGFARATQDLFAALGKRIERENTQLYPLADRAL